jgi:CDGSH-type Zn-finger protein
MISSLIRRTFCTTTPQQLPKIAKLGSYKVKLEKGQTVSWCACGLSGNQPFCDGSHNSIEGFSPIVVEIKETKKYGFCGCKYSENKPFCDGSHRKLPQDASTE